MTCLSSNATIFRAPLLQQRVRPLRQLPLAPRGNSAYLSDVSIGSTPTSAQIDATAKRTTDFGASGVADEYQWFDSKPSASWQWFRGPQHSIQGERPITEDVNLDNPSTDLMCGQEMLGEIFFPLAEHELHSPTDFGVQQQSVYDEYSRTSRNTVGTNVRTSGNPLRGSGIPVMSDRGQDFDADVDVRLNHSTQHLWDRGSGNHDTFSISGGAQAPVYGDGPYRFDGQL